MQSPPGTQPDARNNGWTEPVLMITPEKELAGVDQERIYRRVVARSETDNTCLRNPNRRRGVRAPSKESTLKFYTSQ